jgi:hypothetical protein
MSKLMKCIPRVSVNLFLLPLFNKERQHLTVCTYSSCLLTFRYQNDAWLVSFRAGGYSSAHHGDGILDPSRFESLHGRQDGDNETSLIELCG